MKMKHISAAVLGMAALMGAHGEKPHHLLRQVKVRQLQDSDYGFLISNISQDQDWCITTTEGVGVNANIGFEHCNFDANPSDQLWYLDDDGKIHSKVDPNRCMTVNFGEQVFDGVRTRMADCAQETELNKFIHNGNTDKLRLVGHEDYCITNRGVAAHTSDTIHAKPCKDEGRYIFEYRGADAPPPPPEGDYAFLVSHIREDEPWCIATSNGVEPFANLGLSRCNFDAAPDSQLWRLDTTGKLHSMVNPYLCMIVSHGENLFDGARVRIADCTQDTDLNRFSHYWGTDKLRLVGHEDYCVTNRGTDPNPGDTVHAKPCKDEGRYIFTYRGSLRGTATTAPPPTTVTTAPTNNLFLNQIDVTDVTGSFVNSPLTAWTTPNGDLLVEHLAGRAPNGDLLVFYWQPGQNWRVVNVSQITGQKISGPVTNWVVPNGDLLVEHLAGAAPNGDLLVFYWMSGHDWQVVNLTQITGRKVSSLVTSWVVPNGDMMVEHLAGTAPDSELLVFYWQPGQDWRAVSVTQITGEAIAGPVTSWVTPNGDMMVEHLAGTSPNGDLLVFYWSPENDWQVIDVSERTNTKATGPFCSWMIWDGNRLVEHVAGPSENGDLLVFFWMPDQDWSVINVSSITGVQVKGMPSAYQISRGGFVEELLAAQNQDGSLHLMWWSPALDWQVMNLLRDEFQTPPETWTVPDGSDIVEHTAAVDGSDHLIVSWYNSRARQITDELMDEIPPLTRQRGSRPIVVVLWDPHRPGHPAPLRDEIEDAFLGSISSASQFFKDASLGRFNFEVAEFLPPADGRPGWYDALNPGSHYWDNPDPNSADAARRDPNYHANKYNDGWLSGHVEKWAEAVWMAANDFKFSTSDSDGDGTLSPKELGVCIMIPQQTPGGGRRTNAAGQQVPKWLPLKSDDVNNGVIIPSILEVYTGIPPHAGLLAHELAHLTVDAADLYHGWPVESEYVPFTSGSFSMMTASRGNLDPFHRLKYGWLRHRLVQQSGHYRLRAAIPYGEALVLLDPDHSLKEYFIVENRYNTANSFDASLPDTGLAVWHIIEDSAIFNLSPTPVGTDEAYWESTVNSWGRRGVRLIRPVVTPPITNNRQALWDGSDSSTGYDLLSVDPDPQHSKLRWVSSTTEGSPSGFAIRNISAAGPEMTMDIEVPW